MCSYTTAVNKAYLTSIDFECKYIVYDTIIIQGSFLSIFEIGTLITGEPGIGKSELALSLLSRNHGFIADDAPHFYKLGKAIWGENPLTHPFLSVRGIGLIDLPALGYTHCLNQYPLHLIIHLQKCDPQPPSTHLKGIETTKDILGCLIPCVTIPIINHRNLEVLVETIVKTHLLKVNKENLSLEKFDQLLSNKMRLTHS